jgi:hypothetical protein
MSKHRTDFKRWMEGKKVNYICVFDILKYPNAKIYLIKDYPCNNREELEAEEGREIRDRKCVNKKIPRRSHEEIKERNRKRYCENKDKYNEQQRNRRTAQTQEQKDAINVKQRDAARARLAAETEEEKAERNAKQRARYHANKQAKNNIIV